MKDEMKQGQKAEGRGQKLVSALFLPSALIPLPFILPPSSFILE
jgi:hypothetical protein